MKSNEDKEYEELLRLIEEGADDWIEMNGGLEEFEDLDNPEKPFRTEYQMESITNTGTTRFKKWSAE